MNGHTVDIMAGIKSLTGREREVLILSVEHGYKQPAIAGVLKISRRTVEAHRSSILTKTGANSFNQIAYVWGMCKC